ncbi:NAD(P)/FAD-dependent oxidoreductase|uniref:Phytoene dehydrogenase-related protein n=1 Tax=Dendrosporobacter quercicolus TaxID=146817 RepID=A0A1G9Y861_9FIRM|nr:FAD-dependent oxidoreductase [Dendrosporobacter quercicolus]NSL47554.1 NAD(P)/FAD-dependent oxidoreductase [Dendrosporobacter quercicolus DSM 1736]SDN04725.1 Phytoene dehydrogenase-related protein [Dendrosporobacter quercicolus]
MYTHDEFDVAVIGAGPGGSIAAAYLAKAGLRTVIFEKGEEGGTRYDVPIVRDGFKLDKHLHVILWCTTLNEGQGNWVQAARETGTNLRWEVLPQNAIYADKEVFLPFCSNGEGVIEFLHDIGMDLPEHSKYEMIKVIDAGLACTLEELWSQEFDEKPALGWLKQITDDPHVEAVLRSFVAANSVLADAVALEQGSINTLVTLLINGNFGGRHAIVKMTGEPAHALPVAFLTTVKKNGGTVLVHHTVKNVIVENGKSKGVTVINPDGAEEIYRTKYVVNTATYPDLRKLLGTNIPKHIDEIVTDLYKSNTVALDVHLALKKKVLHHLSAQLMLLTPDGKYDGVIATFSNLDPSWAPPGKQAINVELFLSPADFQKKTKEEWFAHMAEGVYSRWPEVRENVEWTEECIVLSAPVHHGCNAVRKLPLESGIEGLYFAGDCTVGVGYFTERAADSGTKAAKIIIDRHAKNL